jgi:hypothetical protein
MEKQTNTNKLSIVSILLKLAKESTNKPNKNKHVGA